MTEHNATLMEFLREKASRNESQRHRDIFYTCAEDFLLKNGRFFAYHPLSSRHVPGGPNMCFENATNLLTDHEELRYVEGYASAGCPQHHAWCIDAQEGVVDNTPPAVPNAVYFGVVFPTPFVLKHVLKAKHPGIFDNEDALRLLLSRPFVLDGENSVGVDSD